MADIHIEMLEWQLLHQKSSDQYSWHIAGSLILISVFLFSKDVGWEALATKPYTDVLLASNWQTQKQWERWPIALFISLAQTLKRNRFRRYTCVISADVNTGVNTSMNRITRKRKSTDLYVWQIPGSEVHFLYCLPLPDLYGSAWNIFICVIGQAFGQNGWILAEFSFLFFYVFRNGDEVSVQIKVEKERG